MALFKKRIKKRDYPDLDEYIKKHYIEDGMVGEPAVMGAQAMPAQAMSAMMASANMAPSNMAPPKSASSGFFDTVFRQSKKQNADACRGSAPFEEAREGVIEDGSPFEDDSTEVLICAAPLEATADECLCGGFSHIRTLCAYNAEYYWLFNILSGVLI